MTERVSGLLQCPTRVDGTPSLVAHSIDRVTCRSRQRGHYHKCWTCRHLDGRPVSPPGPRPVERTPERKVNAAAAPAAARVKPETRLARAAG